MALGRLLSSRRIGDTASTWQMDQIRPALGRVGQDMPALVFCPVCPPVLGPPSPTCPPAACPPSPSACSWINRLFNNCTAAELAGQPNPPFGAGQPCGWTNAFFNNCLPGERPPANPFLPSGGSILILGAAAMVLLMLTHR